MFTKVYSLFPTLSKMNPTHALVHCFIKIQFNIIISSTPMTHYGLEGLGI
jgi:hypothetical protein